MKKILLLCLALGGCSTIANLESAGLSMNQVYVAANAFDAAENTATQYLKLPACSPGNGYVCRNPAAVTAIANVGRPAVKARQNLVAACLVSTTSADCVSAYGTVTTAVSTLQAIFTQYGKGA